MVILAAFSIASQFAAVDSILSLLYAETQFIKFCYQPEITNESFVDSFIVLCVLALVMCCVQAHVPSFHILVDLNMK